MTQAEGLQQMKKSPKAAWIRDYQGNVGQVQ